MRRARAGFSLAIALVAGALVMLLAGTAMHAWRVQKRLVDHDLALTRAREAAHAGLARACAELSTDPAWHAGLPASALGEATYEMSFEPGEAPFSVNRAAGGTGRGYRGRVIPGGCVDLVSIGRCQGASTVEEAMVWVMPRVRGATTARSGKADVVEPIPGIPPAHPPDDPLPSLVLGTTAERGGARNATPPIGTGMGAQRAGLPPGAHGALLLRGGEVTLRSGVYRFERIRAEGACTIRFDVARGPVVIHLDGSGDSDLSRATLVNPSREARRVLILGTEGATGTIRIATAPQACAVVWAPTARVVLQAGAQSRDFVGVLGGATVTVEAGAALHFDRALEESPVVTRALHSLPLAGGTGGS